MDIQIKGNDVMYPMDSKIVRRNGGSFLGRTVNKITTLVT